ncbi:uncharacterized protein C2845_PM01G22160 [Panicum miliaceum]|uniref:Uncharacterized protein n=1 Tax=Panicum miliaceum TaxID=4540 RepID=A0A3L6TJE5_PANMI|nr:uncharacterized protein C2845_PM01G22160 [Panicum miliaceum]
MDSTTKQLALRPISSRRSGGEVAAAAERSGLATASFRVYHSLPFLWESAPGTPKAAASVSPAEMAGAGAELPPISPPPSYYSSQMKKGRRRCRAGCVLGALLAALGVRRRSRRRPASRL